MASVPSLIPEERGSREEPDPVVKNDRLTDFRAAYDRFQRDLPELLKSKFGLWVAYTPCGNGPELAGDDADALYRRCAERGLRPGHYVIERVLPDPPPILKMCS
jgi:hypothetical protein